MYRSSRYTIALIFLLVVGVGYAAARLINGASGVPAEFSAARLQGALIAQNIVNLSSQTFQDLEKINKLDSQGRLREALDATDQMVVQSQKIREEAVALSGEIEKMTRSLPQVQPFAARQAALESITNRLALISRLINYSAYLNQLSDVLRARFSGASGKQDVSKLIEQINGEVKAINAFDKEAVAAMERFESLSK